MLTIFISAIKLYKFVECILNVIFIDYDHIMAATKTCSKQAHNSTRLHIHSPEVGVPGDAGNAYWTDIYKHFYDR